MCLGARDRTLSKWWNLYKLALQAAHTVRQRTQHPFKRGSTSESFNFEYGMTYPS